AAAAAGVQRFVHMSSMAVYRDFVGLRRESAPLGPANAYGLGKLLGEQMHQAVAAASDMPYVILRPPCVYGETHAATDWTEIMAKVMRRAPLLPLPMGGDFALSMVHVDSLAAACIAGLTTDSVNAAYNAHDAQDVRIIDIVAIYRRVMGRAPLILPIPAILLDTLTWLPTTLNGGLPLSHRMREGIVSDTTAAARYLAFDAGAHTFLDTFREVLTSHRQAMVRPL
ncbi:MAG: NAD-dependent epimerase/dehydratase family protein, partial [Candidatus Sericytochromatia bacterium]|nr:NAD-dependent epimerase/dehydratase family protein [Candidatus Sericytochromatia bacterium]